MSKAETSFEPPNLDSMTFGEAFARCRRNERVLMRWRGNVYNISSAGDVAAGFQRQVEIDRNAMDSGSHATDAPIAGRMVTDRPIGLLRIERQANGGWLVEGRKDVQNDYMTRSDVSGAFTSTADLLRALADLLERDDEKRKEAQDG